MPLRILYLFSDIFFLVNYYFVGYRRSVVAHNLSLSFPEKSNVEIKKIEKQFFINFCDYMMEMAKAFSISEKELKFRIQHLNQDLFYQAKKENKNIILLTGHVFNWEWINVLASIIPQENCFPVYRKIQDGFWEDKIQLIRNRFGNYSLEAGEVVRHILTHPNDGNSVYMFVADQSPSFSQAKYGLKFLNQKTPVFIGYDKLSTKKDFMFIYCDMKKVKRGFYQVNYHQIQPDGDKFEPFEVVKKFHKLLENTIHRDPGNWLWSHRRWKYKDNIKIYEE